MENYKNAYVAAIEAMIQKQKELAAAQQALQEAPTTIGGTTSTTGATWTASSNASATDIWNAKVTANIAARQEQGKTVYTSVGSDGKLHYSTGSQSHADKLAGKKATGSISIPSTGLYNVDEQGDEAIIPPQGRVVKLPMGSGVIPANMTQNLMDIGKYSMSQLLSLFNNKASSVSQESSIDNSKNVTIQHLEVKSDNAKDFVRQLQNLAITTK